MFYRIPVHKLFDQLLKRNSLQLESLNFQKQIEFTLTSKVDAQRSDKLVSSSDALALSQMPKEH